VQGLYILGAFLIVGEQLTFGGLIAFITFANYVLSPINIILSLKIILNQIRPSVDGLKSFYEMEEENYAAALPIAEKISAIEFRDVAVAFDGRDVIKGFNLKISRGEKVAIVGDNGSGKSTLINLLLRLQEPNSGEVLVNGIPIDDYNIEDYRQKFSVVSQGVHLFKGSVSENIALGGDFKIHGDRQKQLKFCTDAIKSWENAFETQIGSDGAKLSGGERQKIALLRALSRKSSVLVLDEPTSNYDKESEEEFNRFIRESDEYDFYFIVTHRKDILDYVDKIVTVGNGSVREFLN